MDTLFFTDEHTMLVEMVRDFADNEITPVARELDENCEFPRNLVNQMAELGLMGIPIPESLGGAGMDTVAFAAAVMELARADASVAITMGAHISLGTMPIVIAGTEEQKKKFVPPLASGEILGAFGLTEPNAGSDAGATKTTAVKKGDEYIINGGKVFITNVGEAGLLNLTARVIEGEEDKEIGAFIVSTDTPGLIINPKEKKMGWCASDTRQIFFEDMAVPAKNMLGTPGKGFKTFLKTLTGGRISIAALSVGTAQGAYERALQYATERKAFGKEIHKFQAIGNKLADMATEIEAAKLLTFHAAWMKDQGLDIQKEAAMAKLFASETAMSVTTEAIQIHGGYGYVKEYDVERYFRDAKILEIGEGTSEIQRLIIAKNIVNSVKAM
ncbi:MAG: acyl-CoA dehydrogenase family protein [Candidatus Marinimicrobia bacterium]|nr:acyl-CoA dehydrogenase family protein [Candidatus Neomarinimicrobiota bacterium]MBL7011097.1 acyl-CoA dehydrogenase family protein [Candidatus Neomarinimicrobiota bacterium]MBL7030814.1 acyl-CoA dehydrogenase family protein [Candidatus Neomarinimicrobiota bacterium]